MVAENTLPFAPGLLLALETPGVFRSSGGRI